MEVYLVRHAIAEERDPLRWPDDGKRPLTPDGAARFESAARGLSRLVPRVDLVLASGFTRAWDTAAILAAEAGWPHALAAPELESGRPPGQAVALLDRNREASSLALVGHEPHLTQVASLLLVGPGATLEIELKKGGVIALTRWTSDEAFLRWIATPKLLRALSSA